MNMKTSISAAHVYEQQFVPTLFQHWSNVMTDLASITSGQRVLDVACGTGVLACAAAKQTGPSGKIIGLDVNQEMLAVARSKAAPVEWCQGQAESLPFADESFDAVVSQFGFMFFDDQRTALQEMMRVLSPGGQLAVAVCDAIDHSPGYAVLAELLQRLFGDTIAQAFRAPFASGDRQYLLDVCTDAGIHNAKITRHDGPVRFDSIDSLVAAERACAWTLGGLLNAQQFNRLQREANESLLPFINSDRQVEFDMPILAMTATKNLK